MTLAPATDVVFPQGNEEKLIAMARTLRVRTLICCYPLTHPGIAGIVHEHANRNDPIVLTAILVTAAQDVSRAQKLTPHIVGPVTLAGDGRVPYLIDAETTEEKDSMHYRRSGYTQVTIESAIRARQTLLVDLAQLAHEPAHIVLGRMLQNNVFFRKYAPQVLVVSGASEALDMRSPRDMAAMLRL